jgi:hypothetical protein
MVRRELGQSERERDSCYTALMVHLHLVIISHFSCNLSFFILHFVCCYLSLCLIVVCISAGYLSIKCVSRPLVAYCYTASAAPCWQTPHWVPSLALCHPRDIRNIRTSTVKTETGILLIEIWRKRRKRQIRCQGIFFEQFCRNIIILSTFSYYNNDIYDVRTRSCSF